MINLPSIVFGTAESTDWPEVVTAPVVTVDDLESWTAGLDQISTVHELAKWMKTTDQAIYRLIRLDLLVAVRINGDSRRGLRISRRAVRNYLIAAETPVKDGIAA